jgi:hypothetical protein
LIWNPASAYPKSEQRSPRVVESEKNPAMTSTLFNLAERKAHVPLPSVIIPFAFLNRPAQNFSSLSMNYSSYLPITCRQTPHCVLVSPIHLM